MINLAVYLLISTILISSVLLVMINFDFIFIEHLIMVILKSSFKCHFFISRHHRLCKGCYLYHDQGFVVSTGKVTPKLQSKVLQKWRSDFHTSDFQTRNQKCRGHLSILTQIALLTAEILLPKRVCPVTVLRCFC